MKQKFLVVFAMTFLILFGNLHCGNNTENRTLSSDHSIDDQNLKIVKELNWASQDDSYWNSIAFAKINLSNNSLPEIPIYSDSTTIPQLSDLARKIASRHYISGLSGLTYNIMMLPGNLVKYDKSSDNYFIITPVALLKNNKQAIIQIVSDADGIDYSKKIVLQNSTTGSIFFGSASFERNTLLETTVQDIAASIAPDSIVNIHQLQYVKSQTPLQNRNQIFFVKSATLTFASYKNSKSTRFKVSVSQTYVTAEHTTFASADDFTRVKLVSLDLISLEDMVFPSADTAATDN